jgi:hypothetical protein
LHFFVSFVFFVLFVMRLNVGKVLEQLRYALLGKLRDLVIAIPGLA